MNDFINRLKEGSLPPLKEPMRITLNMGSLEMNIPRRLYRRSIMGEARVRLSQDAVKHNFKDFSLRKQKPTMFGGFVLRKKTKSVF